LKSRDPRIEEHDFMTLEVPTQAEVLSLLGRIGLTVEV